MYRLTAAGRRELARAREEWDTLARAMTGVLA
jgi:DNA-binding PadR family transcriptional regulator